jgi:hypothetical protein
MQRAMMETQPTLGMSKITLRSPWSHRGGREINAKKTMVYSSILCMYGEHRDRQAIDDEWADRINTDDLDATAEEHMRQHRRQ